MWGFQSNDESEGAISQAKTSTASGFGRSISVDILYSFGTLQYFIQPSSKYKTFHCATWVADSEMHSKI